MESTAWISSPFGHLNVVCCNLTSKSSKGKDSKGESGDKKGVDLAPTIREQRNFSGLKSTLVTRRCSYLRRVRVIARAVYVYYGFN